METSKIVLLPAWCSKLRLTTGVQLAIRRDEFCGPRSDTLRGLPVETTWFPAWLFEVGSLIAGDPNMTWDPLRYALKFPLKLIWCLW
ncbi:hypothetical protein TNCV_3870561 [Trichonephila clavipes]|nr:hypothetical protein TNCV_3870561 [Trichonephila clavipes]